MHEIESKDGCKRWGPRPGMRATNQRRKAQILTKSKAKPSRKKRNAGLREVVLTAYPPQAAIGSFNAKAGTIASIDFLGRPVETDDDEEQPFAPLSLRFIGNPCGNDGHLGGCAVGEGVARAIALASATELARATHFAANRAGENGPLFDLPEVADDCTRTEATIQIKHINSHFEVCGTLEKALHNGKRFVSRSHEGDGQGQTHLPIDDIETHDAETAAGTCFRLTPTSVRLQHRRFSIERFIMFVDGRLDTA